MNIDPKILAIKELRHRCDVTLRHAKDALEQYVSVHPGATWEEAWKDLATVLPKRIEIVDELATLRTELGRVTAERDRARDAIRRYLDLNPDCDYVAGAPDVCPGVDGPCHWCEMRAALISQKDTRAALR